VEPGILARLGPEVGLVGRELLLARRPEDQAEALAEEGRVPDENRTALVDRTPPEALGHGQGDILPYGLRVQCPIDLLHVLHICHTGVFNPSVRVRECNINETARHSAFVAEEDYVGVRLPKKLTDEIDALVAEGHLGFRSRAEFIADSIRRRLEDLGFLGGPKRRR